MTSSISLLRAALLVAVVLWTGGARALSPAQGMELLLTDQGARGLVGYGLLLGDDLTVRLSVQVASLRAVVAFVDGEVRLWHGELLDDRLWLYGEDEGWIDLAAVLAAADATLRLRYDGGREVVVVPWAGALPPGIGPGPPRSYQEDDDDGDDGGDRDDGSEPGSDADDGGRGADDDDDDAADDDDTTDDDDDDGDEADEDDEADETDDEADDDANEADDDDD